MNNYDIIHEFLDGTLGNVEEEQLFEVLANDPELRSEFKQQMALKYAVKSDVAAYTPKVESTMRIFKNLGLVLPVTSIPNSVPIGTKIINFVKLNSAYFYTGLLSAAATLAIVFWLFDFGNIINHKHNDDDKQNIVSEIQKENPNLNNKVNSNKNDEELNLRSVKNEAPTKIIYKYIYVPKYENELSNEYSDIDRTEIANIDKSELSIQKQQFISKISTIKSTVIDETDKFQSGLYNISDLGINTGLTFEIRGSDYQQNRVEGLIDNKEFILPNTGFSLLYIVENEFKVGIDYRREQFHQKFSGIENGKFYYYEQEPNFETYSFLAKFSPNFARYNMFSPYLQGSIGYNVSGPVSRLMIGSDISFGSSIYLNIGYDLSLLLYRQNSSNFISTKTGFHLGAGINF